jgi:TonB family protein
MTAPCRRPPTVLARPVITAMLAVVAAIAGMAPRSEGQQPTKPPGGSSGATTLDAAEGPYQWYLFAIRRKISERWEGRGQAHAHAPVVAFEIGRDGSVSNVSLKESSGSQDYDRTAMRAVADASPFPRLPSELHGSVLRVELRFTVPEIGDLVPGRSPVATATPLGASDPDTAECAKREAIAGSITAIESAKPSARQSADALLAQMARIQKQVSELPPVLWGTCPEHLGIAALSGRLERARAPVRRALEQERLRQAQERRQQEVSTKPWPEKIKRAVLEERIEIGMTGDQVTAAWGRPETINETITATSRREQWIYPGPTHLYFDNGALTTIQRRR